MLNQGELFCHLSSARIAELVRAAKGSVCYAGPGIQDEPAKAMVELAGRIGPEFITVSLDFDEKVMRMGYGTVTAVQKLGEAGIIINHSPGLRSALVIVDKDGYTFAPSPLYLESESDNESTRNALRLSPAQVLEALARLSPAAKAIAVAQTADPVEKSRIAALPVEVGATKVDEALYKQVDERLQIAPPVRFDLARQVRVFEPYLQYVDFKLTGAAIQRFRLAIPPSIQKLGGDKDLEGRMRTTFDLIEKGGKLSSKPLDKALNEIRNNFTPSLGKDHGRVVLKHAKPLLVKRLATFHEMLKEHQAEVGRDLQALLDKSRATIVDYYVKKVMDGPPDALLGQSLSGKATEDGARQWLNGELDRVFPSAEALIKTIALDVKYKDVTFETLNGEDFLESVKQAFPQIDWDKAYEEFRAAGENSSGAR
jgi:hypothetical protein